MAPAAAVAAPPRSANQAAISAARCGSSRVSPSVATARSQASTRWSASELGGRTGPAVPRRTTAGRCRRPGSASATTVVAAHRAVERCGARGRSPSRSPSRLLPDVCDGAALHERHRPAILAHDVVHQVAHGPVPTLESAPSHWWGPTAFTRSTSPRRSGGRACSGPSCVSRLSAARARARRCRALTPIVSDLVGHRGGRRGLGADGGARRRRPARRPSASGAR